MAVIEALRVELQSAEAELAGLRKVEQKVDGFKMAIAALSGEPIPTPTAHRNREFEDLGVTAAARKFLRERMGEPQDTRSIADALLNRGLRTNSKNFIATVYATLNNGKMFQRTKDGRWQLVEYKARSHSFAEYVVTNTKAT